jgi:hypothetical protein
LGRRKTSHQNVTIEPKKLVKVFQGGGPLDKKLGADGLQSMGQGLLVKGEVLSFIKDIAVDFEVKTKRVLLLDDALQTLAEVHVEEEEAGGVSELEVGDAAGPL